MNRFTPYHSVHVIVLLLVCCVSDSVLAAPPATKPAAAPNVVFIVVDDLNNTLRCYGNAAIKTPNIDRLAAASLRFDRAYAQYTLCNPSRASFLTGLRPETLGIYDLKTAPRSVLPESVFLPQLFRQHGYTAGRFGKVFHEGRDDRACWDVTEDVKAEGQEAEAMRRRYANAQGQRTPDWMVLDGGDDVTRDNRVGVRSAEFIENAVKQGKPFFVGAGFYKPHLPWTAPKKYFDLYPAAKILIPAEPPLRNVPPIALMTELTPCPQPASRAEAIAAYRSCISFTDTQIGHVFATMDKLSLWDNTIVVFFSDHGFHLGDHGGLWAKLTLFEQSARVPLLISVPGMPTAGKSCQRTVELLDIYPTLADLCALPAPAQLQGKSLKPLLLDANAPWDKPAYTMVYHGDHLGRSVRTERYRYTEWDGGATAVELYDHEADPSESHNLARRGQRQLEDELRKMLEALAKPKAIQR